VSVRVTSQKDGPVSGLWPDPPLSLRDAGVLPFALPWRQVFGEARCLTGPWSIRLENGLHSAFSSQPHGRVAADLYWSSS
jgi:hypothetical protein